MKKSIQNNACWTWWTGFKTTDAAAINIKISLTAGMTAPIVRSRTAAINIKINMTVGMTAHIARPRTAL